MRLDNQFPLLMIIINTLCLNVQIAETRGKDSMNLVSGYAMRSFEILYCSHGVLRWVLCTFILRDHPYMTFGIC